MEYQPSQPEKWDIDADVVVVGFGAAGVAAAVTAHDLGAKVVILEKAPEGEEGGNTRVAGQGYLNTSSVDKAIAYLTALCGDYSVPDAMVQVWAEEMCQNNAWLESLGGDPQEYDWSEDNRAELAKGWIKTADTIAALAAVVGLDPVTLDATVSRWNCHCAAKHDAEFGRTLMMDPIVEAPFYAVELSPSMLNTQGGPRRNEKGQIVRPDDTPIPRLYSAGELGPIYSYLYQGTGNIGECLAFGRVSGRHAAADPPGPESAWRLIS